MPGTISYFHLVVKCSNAHLQVTAKDYLQTHILYASHQYVHEHIRRSLMVSSSNQGTQIMEHLYGFNVVKAVLTCKSRQHINRLFVHCNLKDNPKLTKSALQTKVDQIIDLARLENIPIVHASKLELNRKAHDRPNQNMVLEATPAKICVSESGPVSGRNLLLHNVGDPQNLGSILRTCLLMNIDHIFLSGGCSQLSPVVAKASSGALEHYLRHKAISQVAGLTRFLESTRVPIMAAVCKGDPNSISTTNTTGLICVGSEGAGLPGAITSKATTLVTLPMARSDLVDSFNISVATALLINKLFSSSS